MSEVEAVAKAVEKAAELGTQTLQTAERAGGFLARVFKQPIEECAGILTDQLRLIRLRRWAEMADEVEYLLHERGVIESRAVPPKLAVPILEYASLEDDPGLAAFWSELLANAMDPNYQAEIPVAYTDIIRNLSPTDARVLLALLDKLQTTTCLNLEQVTEIALGRDEVMRRTGISQLDCMLSFDNLIRVRCIAPKFTRVRPGGGLELSPSTHLSADHGTERVEMTTLGLSFLAACVKDALVTKEPYWRPGGDGRLDIKRPLVARAE